MKAVDSDYDFSEVHASLDKYVEDDLLAMAAAVVLDGKAVVDFHMVGHQDREAECAIQADSIYRIYSSTKLITSCAAMMLWEEDAFRLDDPLQTYLPELGSLKVLKDGAGDASLVEPVAVEPTIRQLMSHNAGFSYGLFAESVVDPLYNEAGVSAPTSTLEDMVRKLADIPLAYQPGQRWQYSVSADVLGRLIEVLSGQSFGEFLSRRIFEPLGMTDTGFFVPEEKRERIVSIYTTVDGKLARFDETVIAQRLPNNYLEWWAKDSDKIALGGAGIVSTAYDYAQFLQMLVNKGNLDGKRILGRKTVEMLSRGLYSESTDATTAIGLSVSVVTGAQKHYHPESEGTFTWGGYFYTSFWVDPQEKFVGVLMSQINPAQTRLDGQFKIMAYSALE